MTLCYSHRQKDPFARIDKRIIDDSSISWKAKGILLYAFSRPEDWNFYRKEMMSHASDGKHSFDSGIKELESVGYLYKTPSMDKDTNYFTGWEWHFFEVPITKEEFKYFIRNTGNRVFQETGYSQKPDTTKKEEKTKKEKNNNKPPVCRGAPPKAERVVSSFLEDFEIPEALKIVLTSKYSEDEIMRACDVVVAMNPHNVAGALIKALEEGWKPAVDREDQEEENRRFLKSLMHLDRTTIGCYTIQISPSVFLALHSQVDGAKSKSYSTKEKNFIYKVKRLLKEISAQKSPGKG